MVARIKRSPHARALGVVLIVLALSWLVSWADEVNTGDEYQSYDPDLGDLNAAPIESQWGYGVQPIQYGSGNVCEPAAPIVPERITYVNGKSGWKVHIPDGQPLATPAYADGRIFVGGGFGTYSFYALDADTGELEWHFATGDDGPTAAVVYNDRVAFNTESCILYVLDTKTGEEIWSQWLGDPLMSQPAIADDLIYMAFPGGGTHYLTCRALETGEEKWTQPIAGDCITAPIIDGHSAFVASLDGTVYNFNVKSGELEWSEKKNATSAPWVVDDEIYVALREEGKSAAGETQQYEGLAKVNRGGGNQLNEELYGKLNADYLVYETESKYAKAQESLDASVGFSAAPPTAGLGEAQENLGVGSVSGIWAYQGSRPLVYDNRSYTAQGDLIRCVDNRSGKVVWENQFKVDDSIGGRALTPPAFANGCLYMGSLEGDIVCVRVEDGKKLWSVNIGETIRFQPVVAKGKIYVGTDLGNIYCLDTGDKKADGWYMWGGNASHNGWES